MECNKLAVDIDNEIVIVHNFLRDKYRLKFPELESLVGAVQGQYSTAQYSTMQYTWQYSTCSNLPQRSQTDTAGN